MLSIMKNSEIKFKRTCGIIGVILMLIACTSEFDNNWWLVEWVGPIIAQIVIFLPSIIFIMMSDLLKKDSEVWKKLD